MQHELIAHYQQEALAKRSNIDWISALQAQACDDLVRLGFPNRSNEAWKYTKIASFLKHKFSAPKHVVAQKDTDFAVNLFDCHQADSRNLPEGVLIVPLRRAIHEHKELVEPYLGRILQTTHAFHALNTAFLDDGLLIYVPSGVKILEPLVLSNWQEAHESAAYLRNLVIMEPNSSLSLIEDYTGKAYDCYLTNSVTEVFLAENAVLTHYKYQRESQQAFHFGQVAVKQSANSVFSGHLFSLGGELVRNDTCIDLVAEGAKCTMNGLYATVGQQCMDQHTQVYHHVANCESNQTYRGMLAGNSRAVFDGYVNVAKHAQKTIANQQNKNIMLSSLAEIDIKPQLDIFADDVTCSHGATIGQLDEEALFYFATRGIQRTEAIFYLMQSFVAPLLKQNPNAALESWITDLLMQHIGGEYV